MLQIAVEKVCDLIINSLALNATLDSGGDDFSEIPTIDETMEFSPPKDDRYLDLKRIIDKFNEEERQHLVALAWLGRGTFSLDEWEDALEEATQLEDTHISDYLVRMPQLGDYLEEGLAELGYSSEGFETGIR
ncbi:DUF3775 domain-containing protein [Sneathiella sp.]|jgi:hypothetical protein|uniref:DUF3775 domain-containing protein n=1 Tax=Sneathiella sp. TaxID=1964365 RepID=UPI0039E681EB